MKRIFYAIPLIIALLFVTAHLAEAQVTETVYYVVQAKHSGKVLDVAGVSREAGVYLHQWDRLDAANQQFLFVPAGDGYYFIEAKHSGMMLTVENNSTSNGAIFRQQPRHGGYNQQFRLDPAGNGYYTIVARHSGKVLDVSAVSYANGAVFHQWDNLGADNQKFKLIAVGARQNEPARIIGGQDITAAPLLDTNIPWQAHLSNPGGSPFCGGSLIRQNWVLTAAHCVEDEAAEDLRVTLGDRQLSRNDGSEQTFGVERVVIHHAYNSSSYVNDIALLKLDRNATLNSTVNTIDLNRDTALAQVNGLISGWGRTIAGNRNSGADMLQVAEVPVITNSSCSQSQSGVTAGMLCAGFRAGGVDSCQGDSGGPLAVKSGATWRLAGITSWGNGCAQANSYGVYTRVSSYLDWIADITTQVKVTVRNDGAFVARFKVTTQVPGYLPSANLPVDLWAGESETYWVSQNATMKVTAWYLDLFGWQKIKTLSGITFSSSTTEQLYRTTGTTFNAKLKKK